MKISAIGHALQETKGTYGNAQNPDGLKMYEPSCDSLTLGQRPLIPLGDTAGIVRIPTECVMED